jgi:nucleoside-diphosphate-sugar epimerase
MENLIMIDVFGSTGFIGSRFCEMYNDEIVRVSRECNIPDNKDVLYLISTVDNYNVFTDLHVDINTNLNKLMDVLENCKEKELIFNFVSSWFVYGDNHASPVSESQPCSPKGFYSITKFAAEQLLESFCKTFNVKYRIFRLCNVYGPNDKGKSKKKNALQYLIDEMKKGNEINLYHGGHFIRDYMHVDDVCRAMKLCMEKAPTNEVINIGSGESVVFKSLIDFVANEVGYKMKINTIEPTEFHKIVQTKNFCLNSNKLFQLGFKKNISIKDGLKQLL